MEVGRKPPQRHLRASKSKGGGGAPPHVPHEISLSKDKAPAICPPPSSQGTKNTLEMLVVVRVGLGVQTML